MLWIRISIRARCTPLCDKVCQWLATGWWFSPGPFLNQPTDDHHIINFDWKIFYISTTDLFMYYSIITLLPFFIEMLQYDWLWSGHVIIKEMFYIPIKLKTELARASIRRVEAWTEAHFLYEAPAQMCLGPRFYTYKAIKKKCIQFLWLHLNHTKIIFF
jgi:hypothetical protein